MCQGLSGLSAGVLMRALGLDKGPGAAIKVERDWKLIILPSKAGSSVKHSTARCAELNSSHCVSSIKTGSPLSHGGTSITGIKMFN